MCFEFCFAECFFSSTRQRPCVAECKKKTLRKQASLSCAKKNLSCAKKYMANKEIISRVLYLYNVYTWQRDSLPCVQQPHSKELDSDSAFSKLHVELLL